MEKSTGDFLGWFHLRPAPDGGRPSEPELGYRLRRSAWGKGYATEGSRALIRKAFAELGAERVYAETMAVHTRLPAGHAEGRPGAGTKLSPDWPDKIEGDEYGDVEYALTRAEWERAQQA